MLDRQTFHERPFIMVAASLRPLVTHRGRCSPNRTRTSLRGLDRKHCPTG